MKILKFLLFLAKKVLTSEISLILYTTTPIVLIIVLLPPIALGILFGTSTFLFLCILLYLIFDGIKDNWKIFSRKYENSKNIHENSE